MKIEMREVNGAIYGSGLMRLGAAHGENGK
jgi:hypothetical protein